MIVAIFWAPYPRRLPATPSDDGTSAVMARLRQVYESGAVVQLPFLTLDQVPPAALLNDPRLDYLPPGASLPEVGTLAAVSNTSSTHSMCWCS